LPFAEANVLRQREERGEKRDIQIDRQGPAKTERECLSHDVMVPEDSESCCCLWGLIEVPWWTFSIGGFSETQHTEPTGIKMSRSVCVSLSKFPQ
jgi:hypothetical protein